MPWVYGLLAVVVIYVVGSAGSLLTSGGAGTVPGAPNACFSKCGFFSEYRCEDGGYMGFCFAFWSCSWGIGLHDCATARVFPFNLFAGNCQRPQV